jgi:hypothetical protein
MGIVNKNSTDMQTVFEQSDFIFVIKDNEGNIKSSIKLTWFDNNTKLKKKFTVRFYKWYSDKPHIRWQGGIGYWEPRKTEQTNLIPTLNNAREFFKQHIF